MIMKLQKHAQMVKQPSMLVAREKKRGAYRKKLPNKITKTAACGTLMYIMIHGR